MHTFKAGVTFFEGMIKFLNQDGIYLIEDVTPNDMYKDYFSNFLEKFTVQFIKGIRPNESYAGDNNRLILIFKNNVK